MFFFSSKYSLFHNVNLFGSCIIHILYTECAKIKKKIRRQRVNIQIQPQKQPKYKVLSIFHPQR